MKTSDKKAEAENMSVKILASVNKAYRKMAEAAAANNESLIVGDNNGGFKSVPAKKLLRDLPDNA